MKKVYGLVLVIALLMVFLAAERMAGSEASSLPSEDSKIVHAVFFWLKEGTSQEQKEKLIEDCNTLLRAVPSVRYVAAGPPVGAGGGAVDGSYGVGLVVHFDDEAGLEHYSKAPRHLEFIQRHKSLWEKVQVYDFQVK